MPSDWERERARIAREQERQRKAAEKEERERYEASRRAEEAWENQRVEAEVHALQTILVEGLQRMPGFRFDDLKRVFVEPVLDLQQLAFPLPQPDPARYLPRPPGWFSTMFGGRGRYEKARPRAEQHYQQAVQQWEMAEAQRQEKVRLAWQAHAEQVARARAEVEAYNRTVDNHRREFEQRDREAVERYAETVLENMPCPGEFPQRFELTYSGAIQEEILVRYELPGTDVVPSAASFRYVKKNDEIVAKPRTKKDADELYRSAIAQVSLLVIRELLEADANLQRVGFNGHVDAIDPATGRQEYPCLISVVVDRENFEELVLERVDSGTCLRQLQAIVSRNPYALDGIQPILDFDLTKYKFIDGLDAASTLDSRPDLMEMSPENFEHLVRQVFEAEPEFQGWTTTRSHDDGVDAVVTNNTSLVGGLAVVQAKRYKRALGPEHIRELAGTMDEKRAGKGILVTTAWFTPTAQTKARENGRIELIDGLRLKYLIKENLGKDVLIKVSYPQHVLKDGGQSAEPA